MKPQRHKIEGGNPQLKSIVWRPPVVRVCLKAAQGSFLGKQTLQVNWEQDFPSKQ